MNKFPKPKVEDQVPRVEDIKDRKANTPSSPSKTNWIQCPFPPCDYGVKAYQMYNLYGHLRKAIEKDEQDLQ